MLRPTSSAMPYAILASALLLTAILTYRPIFEPITNDGTFYPLMARVIAGQITHNHFDLDHGGGIWHPMLYPTCLTLIAKFIGDDLIYVRLFGLICGVLSAALAFRLVLILLPADPQRYLAGALAVAVFLTNPFGHIGMLGTDIDNSIIPPIILLAASAAISFSQRPKPIGIAKLIIAQAGLFWTKLTTAFLLPPALFLRLWMGQTRQALWLSCIVGAAGLGTFALTWVAYCHVMGFPADRLLRIFEVFRDKASFWHNAPNLIRSTAGVTLWLNPAFLILGLLSAWITFRFVDDDQLKKDLLYLLFLGWSIVLGYIFIGGVVYTIPKYQYPAISILSVVIGVVAVKESRSFQWNWRWGITFVVAAAYYFAIPDSIYDLFHGTREYLYLHNQTRQIPGPFLLLVARDFALVLLPVVVALISGSSTRTLFPGLLLIMFAFNLGIGLKQFRSGYATTFNYGSQGAEEVLRDIRDGSTVLLYEGAILGPRENKTIYFRDIPDPSAVRPAEILHQLETVSPDYFVVGLSMNTLDEMFQLRNDPAVQSYLAQHFAEAHYGDFTVYQKRSR
jgi:hypothetical protein